MRSTAVCVSCAVSFESLAHQPKVRESCRKMTTRPKTIHELVGKICDSVASIAAGCRRVSKQKIKSIWVHAIHSSSRG